MLPDIDVMLKDHFCCEFVSDDDYDDGDKMSARRYWRCPVCGAQLHEDGKDE